MTILRQVADLAEEADDVIDRQDVGAAAVLSAEIDMKLAQLQVERRETSAASVEEGREMDALIAALKEAQFGLYYGFNPEACSTTGAVEVAA